MKTRGTRETGSLGRPSFPSWMVKRVGQSEDASRTREIVRELALSTVCGSARCPNAAECFSSGTATFLILGDVCTRGCAFCAVGRGRPRPVDEGEPERVAEAVGRMGLEHAVVTMVTRDDLADGGAEHFAKTIRAIRARSGATVEALVSDLGGSSQALDTVLEAEPDVLNHNIETVRRLYGEVRPGADYERSLALLARAGEFGRGVVTKSGLMVGMGETREELLQAFRDLAGVRCAMLTLGQYLPPTPKHFPLARFVPPEEFEKMRVEAIAAGIAAVAAGPFVRSSYHAREELESLRSRSRGIRVKRRLDDGAV
ncbi:MAG: lipoyl synthase [Planctomycetota bacterium]